MARRPAVLRAQPCALAAAAALALACALYYAGSGPAQRALPPPPPPAPPSPSPAAPAPESKAKAGEELLRAEAAELHVLAVLAKAERNEALRAKAAAALRSLVRFGKLGPREALALHLLCDGPSRSPARQLLQQALRPAAFKYKVVFHDLEVLAQKLQPTVEAMQKLFSAGAGSYYGDSLFFLSVAMHHIMPREVSRIIQVDLDVEYRANIRELFQEFDNFPEGAVIGIAREMQPVYRYVAMPGTSSGSIGRNIPGPRWGIPLRMGCLASTVGCCCWTWRPCASRSATTVCWNRRWCSSWPASSTSRATWGTRTSSLWWAWNTPSCSTSWTAPGTASSAPGGVTTATATSLSTTSTATATSASTMGTATRPSRRSSSCLGGQQGELPCGDWRWPLGPSEKQSSSSPSRLPRDGRGPCSPLGRSHCLELQLHLALEPGRGWDVRQKGLCGGVSCQ